MQTLYITSLMSAERAAAEEVAAKNQAMQLEAEATAAEEQREKDHARERAESEVKAEERRREEEEVMDLKYDVLPPKLIQVSSYIHNDPLQFRI